MNTETVPVLPLPCREYNDPERSTIEVTHKCPDSGCGNVNKLRVYGALRRGEKVPKGDYVFICSDCALPVLVRVGQWPEPTLEPLYLAASTRAGSSDGCPKAGWHLETKNCEKFAGLKLRQRGRPKLSEPNDRQRRILELVQRYTHAEVAREVGVVKQEVGRVVKRWPNWSQPRKGRFELGAIIEWKDRQYTVIASNVPEGNLVDRKTGQNCYRFQWKWAGDKLKKVGFDAKVAAPEAHGKKYSPPCYLNYARVYQIAKADKGIQARFGTVQDFIYRSDGKPFAFPREVFRATEFIHERGLRGQYAARAEAIFELAKVFKLALDTCPHRPESPDTVLSFRISQSDVDSAEAILKQKPIIGVSSVGQLSRKLLLDSLAGKLFYTRQEGNIEGPASVPAIAAPLGEKCLQLEQHFTVVRCFRIAKHHSNDINALLRTKPIAGVFSGAQLARKILLDFLAGELSYRESQDWETDAFFLSAAT